MSQYLVTRVDHFSVERIFSDNFDTTDQLKWDALLKIAHEIYDAYQDDELLLFPLTAPADYLIWLNLYEIIGTEVYEKVEDWESPYPDNYETNFFIQDEQGSHLSISTNS